MENIRADYTIQDRIKQEEQTPREAYIQILEPSDYGKTHLIKVKILLDQDSPERKLSHLYTIGYVPLDISKDTPIGEALRMIREGIEKLLKDSEEVF